MIEIGRFLPPFTKYALFEDTNMRTGAKWGAVIGLVHRLSCI